MFRSEYKIIKKSGLFDEKYYLKNYEDVRKADVNPIKHYLKSGWKEGRNPSENFDTNFYLETYNDVKNLGINPLLHFIKYGKIEGRKSCLFAEPMYEKHLSKIEKLIRLISIIKNNPELVKRTFIKVKLYGLKKTIQKINDKYESIEKSIITSNKINNFDNLFNENILIPKLKTEKPIDIIIPVFNGLKYLEPLFISIINNTSINYRLLICNDKSSDEKVLPLLKQFKNDNPSIDIILLENEKNLGFIKTVNKLVTYTNNHFVLLNTDTEVPPHWLERLMYPIFEMENIASTTPFTNAGTICSFPNYLEDNLIFENMAVEELDRYFQYVNFEKTFIEIPTGVGFCMGVNKSLVNKIGMFDEIFGKGYSEENDWCQRAIKEGYKNIHITNLFVYHKHGGSFSSSEKLFLMENNLNILLDRYPTYMESVNELVRKDELSDLRNIIKRKIELDIKKRTYKKCFYCGFISSPTGVGNAARSYIKILENLGYEVVKFDLTLDNLWYEKLRNNIFIEYPSFIVLHFNANTLLDFMAFNYDSFKEIKQYFYIIGAWAWESDIPSEDFLPASKFLNEIWSISSFMDTSLHSLPIKTNVIPLLVEKKENSSTDLTNPTIKKLLQLRKEYNFIVGYFFDLRSYIYRKNPEATIKVFTELFEKDKKSLLILKISGKDDFANDFNNILKTCSKYSNIVIFDDIWDEESISFAYNNLDVYLAPFRIEGFGYTIAEAMLHKKPVLCVNYSGVTDFCLKDERVNIKYDLITLKQNWGPYKKGLIWVEPNIEDIKLKLLYLYENKSIRIELGEKSYEKIIETLSLDALSKIMLKITNKIF